MAAEQARVRGEGETFRPRTTAWSLALAASLLTLGWSGPAHAELAPLRTAAALSARPRACAVPRSAANRWSRAAEAARTRVARECSLLARISGALRTDPKAAAELAAQSLPATRGTDAPQVAPGEGVSVDVELVRGRLALAAGEPGLALQLFEAAARRHPLPEWDPGALHDYAVSAALERRLELSAGLYRRLVAIAAWLSPRERLAVRLEAALALLRVASSPEAALVALEAVDSVRASSAGETDSQVADLTLVLVEITTVLTGAASRDALRRVAVSEERSLRGVARLTDHDWRLVESWREWRTTREPAAWTWTNDAGVPAVYRSLAERLTAEP